MHYRYGIALALVLLCGTFANAASVGDKAGCRDLNLDFGNKEAGWKHQPLSKLKHDTTYMLEQQDGRTVLRAFADRSASFYEAPVRTSVPPVLSWRWKADSLVPGADNRDKKREDSPVRVIVNFDGDKSTLPKAEQTSLKRAKMISGRDVPYAVLMYIWSEQVPVGTVIPSAHTSQVKMLVVASGKEGVGAWQSVRRNIAADYRKAYGADPGRVTGVAVMTDTDNTGTKVTGWYSDIRFECSKE